MIYDFDNKEFGNDLRDLLLFGPISSEYLKNRSRIIIPLINSDALLERSMFYLEKFYGSGSFSNLIEKYGKEYIVKCYNHQAYSESVLFLLSMTIALIEQASNISGRAMSELTFIYAKADEVQRSKEKILNTLNSIFRNVVVL